MNGEKYTLTIKDSAKGDGSGWVEYIPQARKDQAGAGLREHCDELIPYSKQPLRLRADNEPCFKGPLSSWRKEARVIGRERGTRRPIIGFGKPYNPQTQGDVERANGVGGSKLRATMTGVDKRLWPYGIRHVGWCANRRRINKSVLSPFEKIHGKPPRLGNLWRFGCYCIAKNYPKAGQSTGANRGVRGVYLGVSRLNGVPLVGIWKKPDKGGKLKWTVIQCARIRPYESVLVSNVDDLKPDREVRITEPDPVNDEYFECKPDSAVRDKVIAKDDGTD